MSGRGLFKCCIILVVQQDGIHKLMIKMMSSFTCIMEQHQLTGRVSSYGVLSLHP